jgi:sugar (pentulose or hexulose) kinase
MARTPVIAIFDIGKTNKKLFLFDSQYQMVYERSSQFEEIVDEDGDSCENLEALRTSVFSLLREVLQNEEFDVKAVNFSTYGASFVYLDDQGQPLTPLYNYLKAYPPALQKQFYDQYGGEEEFSHVTASPVLGSLNSGMQLYRIRHERPELFEKILYALHLPQYISYLITGVPATDITSIGCHTNLWNFNTKSYHEWVSKEGLIDKLPAIKPGDMGIQTSFEGKELVAGIGLHDSSAALIPYLMSFREPFVLISTGTWCISLNPFNDSPLTTEELEHDCLCYLTYEGRPVKASRLFAGHEHEVEVQRIAEYFQQDKSRYKGILYESAYVENYIDEFFHEGFKKSTQSIAEDLSTYKNDVEAYHHLIWCLVVKQYFSTILIADETTVKRIFVDGGFSKNSIYMNLLAKMFKNAEIYAASMSQATAIGTALALHHAWNEKELPGDIIELKRYVSHF